MYERLRVLFSLVSARLYYPFTASFQLRYKLYIYNPWVINININQYPKKIIEDYKELTIYVPRHAGSVIHLDPISCFCRSEIAISDNQLHSDRFFQPRIRIRHSASVCYLMLGHINIMSVLLHVDIQSSVFAVTLPMCLCQSCAMSILINTVVKVQN